MFAIQIVVSCLALSCMCTFSRNPHFYHDLWHGKLPLGKFAARANFKLLPVPLVDEQRERNRRLFVHSSGAQYFHFHDRFCEMSINFKLPLADRSGLGQLLMRITSKRSAKYPGVSYTLDNDNLLSGSMFLKGEYIGYLDEGCVQYI